MDKAFGTHRGVVVSTEDPSGNGRVRLRVFHLFGDAPTEWAEPTTPGGEVPVPGSTVWVTFNGGDINKPVYFSGSPVPDLSGYVLTTDPRLSDARTPSNDSNLVHKAGSETITGAKDFTGGLNKSGVSVATVNDVSTADEDVKILTLMGVL